MEIWSTRSGAKPGRRVSPAARGAANHPHPAEIHLLLHQFLLHLATWLARRPADGPRGHSRDDRVGRDVVLHHGSRADDDAVADLYGAQDGRPRADEHVVPHFRVPIHVSSPGASEGHVVQDGHVLSHHDGLANDNPSAMVDEQPIAQPRPRMDVDLKLLVGLTVQEARQHLPPRVPQPVRHPVRQQRMKACKSARQPVPTPPVPSASQRRTPLKYSSTSMYVCVAGSLSTTARMSLRTDSRNSGALSSASMNNACTCVLIMLGL
eukprot:scaffold1330_cov240-Pinguiococcus_pyrenoidosus.AAC.38